MEISGIHSGFVIDLLINELLPLVINQINAPLVAESFLQV